MYRIAFAAVCAVALIFVSLGTSTPVSAHGTCKVLAFEVNDFGKKGPAADAKRLLDVHIANWAKTNKIKSHHTRGKKEVQCRLFLDFGFFDEWTCKASQTVCY